MVLDRDESMMSINKNTYYLTYKLTDCHCNPGGSNLCLNAHYLLQKEILCCRSENNLLGWVLE